MFCPQCGFKLEDDAKFCGKCGRKITFNSVNNNVNEESKMETPVSRPVFVPSKKQNNSSDVFASVMSVFKEKQYSSIPVINTFKKICLSPLSLVAVVSYVLMVLINFSNAEYIGVQIYGIVSEVADVASSPILENLLETIDTYVLVLPIISNLPGILTAIGLCMVVFSAIVDKDRVSSSGFGLVRTVYSVCAVFMIIVIILSAIVLFRISALMPEPAFFIVVSLVVLGAMGFGVFCIFKINDSIDAVRYALDRHIPTIGISGIVTFLAFLSGVVMLVDMFKGEGNSAVSFFGAVAYICFGILICLYKSRMEDLRYLPKEENANGTEQTEYTPITTGARNNTSGISVGKIVSCVAVVLVVIIGAVAIFKDGASTNPDVDERIVGKWRYNSNAEAVTQFKSNGVYIGNEGTDDEERGTFRTENGVLFITVNGNESEYNYRVMSDDIIKIERKFYNSNWSLYYEYVEFYRVT